MDLFNIGDVFSSAIQAPNQDQFIKQWQQTVLESDLPMSKTSEIAIKAYLHQMWQISNSSIKELYLCAKCNHTKLTQTEVAKRLNIPLRTFQSWIIGERTPPATMKLQLIRYLGLLPSLQPIIESVQATKDTGDKMHHANEIAVAMYAAYKERKDFMNHIIKAQPVHMSQVQLCIADLVANDYDINLDGFLAAGFDLSDVPELVLSAVESTTGKNPTIFFYYGFKDHEELLDSPFGINRNDAPESLDEALEMWVPVILGQHIDWELLAGDM